MAVTMIESTLLAALVLFFWGAMVYAGLLRNYFPKHFAAIARPKDDQRLWGVAIEKVIQGALLTLLFSYVARPGMSGLAQGLAFGVFMGLLMELTTFFGVWTSFRVRASAVAVTTSLGVGRFIVAGMIIGAMHG